MRIFPILAAIVASVSIYLFVFERDRVEGFASGGGAAEPPVVEAAGEETAPEHGAVSVVAVRSTAREIDSAVVLRGRTEAARQVDVRAETSGQVDSEPLRKGSFVETGQLLCELDPGTRGAALAEAQARLTEAQARVPEAEARLEEARARLEEALINDNAASRLKQDGFASETRVASAKAALSSAQAAVQTAKSGLESTRSNIQSAEAAVAAAEKEIDRLRITAPFAGLLESDAAELGSLMQPGALCATIIQLDPIKLVGYVPETQVSRIGTGAPAGARLVDGSEVQGQVTFLSRAADPQTRTFRVEITVPNPDLRLRDGQTAEILIGADGAMAHLLPQSALTLNDQGALGVRVVSADQTAEFVPVTLLRDTSKGVWLSGLPDRADVIVIGQEYVSTGVKVNPSFREVGQ